MINQPEPSRLSATYDSVALRQIFEHVDKNKLGKILPFETILNVRKLKLNKRKRGSRGGMKKSEFPQGVNKNNLTEIKMGSQRIHDNSKQVSIMTVNCRSVKSKSELICDIMIEQKIDIAVLTETWLADTYDELWIKTCDLNTNGFALDTENRHGKKGGGLALVTTNNVSNVKKVVLQRPRTFEVALWQLMMNDLSYNVLGIYRPPSSHLYNTAMFIDEYTEFLTRILPQYNSLVILGDFNIHVNDESDADAMIFKDTMQAFGLTQHVEGPTHRCGNTLDQIFTKTTGSIRVMNSSILPFVSDHNPVVISVDQERTKFKTKTTNARNLRKLDPGSLGKEFNNDNICYGDDLTSMVLSFETELKRVIDKLAPIRNIKTKDKLLAPWFDHEVLLQKRKVRSLEDKWHKYKLDSIWLEYLKQRRVYVNLMRQKKKIHFSNKVLDMKGDSKSLHALINSLTGTVKSNPLPETDTDEELANHFADFFINKIQKIRDALQHHPFYEPTA